MSDPGKNILERFSRKLENFLPYCNGTILIALSGGGDSLALALLLLETRKNHKQKLAAYHLNHCLRSDESSSDAKFVKKWCQKKNLEFKIEEAKELEKYRKKFDLSLEEAAREYRYERLVKYAEEIQASVIMSGHTLDDDVETFLLRLGTGGSLKSASGIPEISQRNGIILIRPLLTFKREELRAYLTTRKETWREDSSNLETLGLRNKVRLNLIPAFKDTFQRDIRDSIGRTLENLKRENDFVDKILLEKGFPHKFWTGFSSEWKKGYIARVDELKTAHPSLRNRIILWALDELGLPIKRRKADIFDMTERFLNPIGGKRCHNIGNDIYIARSGKTFIIAKAKRIPDGSEFNPKANQAFGYIKEVREMEKKKEKRITKPGIYKIGDIEITVEAVDRTEMELSKSKPKEEGVEYFDESILEGGFELVSGASITSCESKSERDKMRKDYIDLGNKALVDQWVKWPVLKKDDELIWIVGVSRRKVYKAEESKKAIKIKASLPSKYKISL